MSRCLTTAPRSPRSAQLLRTTALLTLIPLLAATQPAFADMILDNGNAPTSTGTTSAVTGTWSTGDEIWWDDAAGQYVALGTEEVGVLTNPSGAVDLTLDGTIDIGGLQVDDNGFTLSAGTLTNSAGTLLLTTTDSGTQLTTNSALAGDVSVEGGLELLHRGTSDGVGTMEIATGSTLTNSGSITGDIDNDGHVNLETGGTVTGAVTNAGTLDISDATITGTLDNQSGATLTVSAPTKASITGDVQNDGAILGDVDSTTLEIGGRLTSGGKIDTVQNNDSLTIRATEILITDWSDVDTDDVTLYGTRVNQTDLVYDDGTTLSTDVIRGGILNEGAGTVTVKDDLNASNFNITNENEFKVASANWPLINRVTNVNHFNNSGSDAELTIETRAALSALTIANSGTINVNGSLSGTVDNNGTLDVDGTLTGAVNNSGTMGVAGEVSGTVTNEADAVLTSTGTLGGLINESADLDNSIAGDVTGDVYNRNGATLTSTAEVGGNFWNNGALTVSGTIHGTLTNRVASAANVTLNLGGNLNVGGLVNNGSITIDDNRTLTSGTAVDNNGTLDVDGTLTGSVNNDKRLDVAGTVSGKVTNNDGGTLISTGNIGALENDSEHATISGTVTGDVENKDDGVLVSSAAIGGDVQNDGTATLSNSVGGTITNDGTLNVAGNLTTGQNVNGSGATVINNHTLNLSGNLTGRVQNDGTMNMTGGSLTGSLVNTDLLTLSGNNSVSGDLTSTGMILGTSPDASLSLTDGIFFLTDGEVNVTAGNTLTITADLFEIGEDADYENANVTLIGGLANSGTMNLSDADTFEGDLLNRATGNATISAAIDAAGFDVTNEGDFLVTSDANTVGNLHNVTTLTNSGTFDIDSGASVSAVNTVNTDGTMTVGGSLTTGTVDNQQNATLELDGGTVTGNVNNTGEVTGNGTIDGVLTNDGTVRVDAGDTLTSTSQVKNNDTVELDGTLAAGLLNNKDGTVTMNGGTVSGAVDNRGELTGTGTITGALTNSGEADLGGTLSGVENSGTLGTNGDLSVASLNNTGTVNIDTGDTLSSTATVDNRKTLNVSGTLDAALTNKFGAVTEMKGGTLEGNVANNGTLKGTGTIEGVLTNSRTAAIAGAAGEIINSGTLTSTGDLDIQTLTNTGTTNVRANTRMTVETPLSNQGNLNVAGNLVTKLTNQLGATTTLTGGTITGNVSNAGNLGGNGSIDGTLTNRGTVEILAGNRLAATSTNNYKTLTINGTLDGTLINRAAGTTRLNSGTIDGAVTNLGNLTGIGDITGALSNSGFANVGGVLGALTNSGTLTTYGTDLTVASLNNTGLVSIGVDEQLIVTGTATNQSNGTVAVNDGSMLVGSIVNQGKIRGNGIITGTLTSDGGTLDIDGSMTVGSLNNIGALTIAADDTLISKQQAANSGQLTLRGTLDGDLLNNGRVDLGGGTIAGNVTNAAGKTIAGTGTITGDLTNSGLARLTGKIGNVLNNLTLETTGTLTVASLSNAKTGTVSVEAGEELQSSSPVQNAGQFNLGGKLTGGINNLDGATATLTGGTITANLVNEGLVTGTAAINGNLINRNGTADIGGSIGVDLINLGGTITTGDLTVEGRILNSATQTLVLRQKSPVVNAAGTPGLITIAQGATTTAKKGTQNGPGATIQINGTLVSDIFNNGTVVNDGQLTGTVTNLSSFESNGALNGSIITGYYDKKYYDGASAEVNGRVTGDVTFAAGSLSLGNGTNIGGSLNLLKSYTLADGTRVNAAQTLVGSGTTLSLGGTIGGKLVNEGTIKLSDNSAAIVGNLDNNGTLDLRNSSPNTVLTTQGLSGNGVIALDVFTGEILGGDKVVVAGGATTGNIHLTFAELPTVGGAAIGKTTTLVDVDDDYTNNYNYSFDELAASSERIVYSVEKGTDGDIQLVSQTNPAIGAMFANVTLVQSLIGSVINRPTSPYVTGLVTDYADKPCGVGGWGRATGGNATVQGKTNNQVSTAENEVSASYYGMQGGVDLVCFDDRFAGWDMSFGLLGGVNIGDSRQPIYAIDSRNSQVTTGVLASITTTDFQQVYGGAYLTGTKGRWTADLQLRGEKTDFELKNKQVEGSGLRVETPDFSSDGITLSGSLAYSIPVKDTGWIVTPNVGFSWSKYSTDSISFEGDFELEFDDSERQIGFIGASIGKTFVYESQNAAIHTFATATYFKDFADDAVSRLYNGTLDGYATQVLTSENLKNYGEVSVGANYVKVLNPGKSGRPRQLSTSARIDGRFGDTIDSVGVTGQFRLQF